MLSVASAKRSSGSGPDVQARRKESLAPSASRHALQLLAYVHLRNIHGSTGAGRVARQLVEHLAGRSDVALTVLADARDRERVLPLVGEPWTGFSYRTFARDTSRQQAIWCALQRPHAESFLPEAQVVFCTGESFVPVRRARLAVTVHDAAYFDAGAHHQNPAFHLQRLKWRLLFARLCRSADMIHTVSNFSAERIAHHFPALASRIRVVHNGVTPLFFAPVTDLGRSELHAAGLGNGRQYVLIPGGLHFRKNAELILQAAPRLLALDSDVQLVIVNHSDPAYRARAAALGDRVRVLGFVSDDLLHALYTGAAAVWYPSRYEGFGLPLVEAMAAGAPVVASDAASLPEIARSAALLVNPGAPSAHVEALEHLLRSSRVADHLRVAGRLRARNFTWPVAAAKLKQHFNALI